MQSRNEGATKCVVQKLGVRRKATMTTREPISPQKKKVKNAKTQEGSKHTLNDLPVNGEALAIQGGFCATGSHIPEVKV